MQKFSNRTNKFNLLLFTLCSLLTFSSIQGQEEMTFTRDASIPVIDIEDLTMKNPWVGGVNASQISKFDANLDGLMDIYIFDRDGNRSLVFLNESADAGNENYVHAPEYSTVFPELKNWALLRDYNCDGKMDIFANFQSSIIVYENVSTTELEFSTDPITIVADYDFGGGPQSLPAFCISVDIPAIYDYDGDGDLEILSFTEGAATMYFYNCLDIEEGNCGDLTYKCTNRCYGQVNEDGASNNLYWAEDHVCAFNVVDPRSFESGHNSSDDDRTGLHAGGCICAFDFDDDGNKDMMIGDVSFNNLVAVYMDDAQDGQDSTYHVDYNGPSEIMDAPPVDLQKFPCGYYEDINNDGVEDLMVCPNSRFEINYHQGVWYYLNEGTTEAPDFTLIKKNFLQETMLDFGRMAHPVPFDVNADGLNDIIVANGEYYVDVDSHPSQLAILENIGTADAPEYMLVDSNYLNIPQYQLENIHPAFGDLDNDGDLDLIIGEELGGLHYFSNEAAMGDPADFVLTEPAMSDSEGEQIDPGQFSTPQIFDLNEDGLLDLIVGEKNGNMNFYQNIGTDTDPEFQLFTESMFGDTLGGVIANNLLGINGYAVPFFFHNEEGEIELLLGTEVGFINHYTNISGNIGGEWTLASENILPEKPGERSACFLADVDNDTFPDMVTGIVNGGLIFYGGNDPSSTEDILVQTNFELYPNPVENSLLIKLETARVGEFLEILDVNGKLIRTVSLNGKFVQEINVGDLSQGIYFVRLMSGNHSSTQRFIKL